ncbi:MFS transporter [Arthrobacter sp. MMS24-S77]
METPPPSATPLAPDTTAFSGPDSPTTAPTRVIVTMALAQFGLFLALLAPVMVSLALKAQSVFPAEQAAPATGTILSIAALVAMIGNPVFGRLSDLTMSRFGRRRPWMAGGAAVFVLAMVLMALAGDFTTLLLGWCLAQLAGNAVLAPLLATIADQVPERQLAGVSANVGIMQNLGILAAAYVANFFVNDLLMLFLIPSLFAAALILLFCFILPDRALTERPETNGWMALLMTFWVNPVKHPDFAWAWISRFLLTLGMFLFITFQFFFLQDHLRLGTGDAVAALALGLLIYTAALTVTAKIGGWLSDRLGRRKAFVFVSTAVFAIGLGLLVFAAGTEMFYVAQLVMGAGAGVYYAVDMALVIDVLPNPEDSAKDLGVFNIANALPQSLAGGLGAVILGTSGGTTRSCSSSPQRLDWPEP